MLLNKAASTVSSFTFFKILTLLLTIYKSLLKYKCFINDFHYSSWSQYEELCLQQFKELVALQMLLNSHISGPLTMLAGVDGSWRQTPYRSQVPHP